MSHFLETNLLWMPPFTLSKVWVSDLPLVGAHGSLGLPKKTIRPARHPPIWLRQSTTKHIALWSEDPANPTWQPDLAFRPSESYILWTCFWLVPLLDLSKPHQVPYCWQRKLREVQVVGQASLQADQFQNLESRLLSRFFLAARSMFHPIFHPWASMFLLAEVGWGGDTWGSHTLSSSKLDHEGQ